MSSALEHREPPGRIEKACYALLVGSLLLVAAKGVQLARSTPPPSPAATSASTSAGSLGTRVRPPAANAIRVVAADPFHPERSGPATRYLLPEDQAVATSTGPGPLREGVVRLLGTAVLGEDGGFVMCQVGNATAQVVRVGDVVGDLTLRSIARGEAEFTRQDGSMVTLSVPSARAAAGPGPGS